MKNQPISHGTFSIERRYEALPADVFRAWSDIDLKAKWFIGPEKWSLFRRELDFRVGGSEILHGRFENGRETLYTARYHHIAPNTRIVCVYDMHLNQTHHSLSLATIEIKPVPNGTRLLFTEQVAFLDGTIGAEGTLSREHGTAAHLDRLGLHLPSLSAAN
jgi:uncharacterized protein YndB with AHSA1/START domain